MQLETKPSVSLLELGDNVCRPSAEMGHIRGLGNPRDWGGRASSWTRVEYLMKGAERVPVTGEQSRARPGAE